MCKAVEAHEMVRLHMGASLGIKPWKQYVGNKSLTEVRQDCKTISEILPVL